MEWKKKSTIQLKKKVALVLSITYIYINSQININKISEQFDTLKQQKIKYHTPKPQPKVDIKKWLSNS